MSKDGSLVTHFLTRPVVSCLSATLCIVFTLIEESHSHSVIPVVGLTMSSHIERKYQDPAQYAYPLSFVSLTSDDR